MAEFLTFREIADKLNVCVDTVRRTVRRLSKNSEITLLKRKTPASKGATVHCLSVDDANKLISYFENSNKPISGENIDEATLQRFGYFYIIQLIPEAMPNRVKIGYTDNLETRLQEHQTSAPTAKYIGHWKCKRSWDQAAMDSITREDCKFIMNEVYEGDIKSFLKRAEEFFLIMPKSSKKILSEYSPLKKGK